MTMFEIYSNLLKKYSKKKVHIIHSDENSEKLVFHLRYMYNDIDAEDKDGLLVTNNDQKLLNNLEDDIINNCVLKGLSKIEKVTMREIRCQKIKKDGTIENKKEIVLDTTGTNLKDILMLSDLVNQNKTLSNDIHEVHELLGIEAARQLLRDEINGVLDGSGIYVNIRHLDLLTDLMTCKGILISMDRHGINKSDAGPLTKASFEEPHEHLVASSLFNVSDNMKSLTSNLIMGQVGCFGTGMADIVFDNEMIQKNAFRNQIQKEQKRKVINLKKR